jgi:DNA replication licensing factor MCM2
VNDERMADFIISSHMSSHPSHPNLNVKRRFEASQADDVLDQELLQKYILYARTLNPVASDSHTAVVNDFYAEIRRVAHATGGINIGVRHLESILRLAQANARMELREQVTQQDVNNAIATCLESFIQTQKHQVAEELRKRFSRFLVRSDDDYDLLHWLLQREYRAAVVMAQDLDKDLETVCVLRADFQRIASEYELVTDDYLESGMFKEAFFLSGNEIRKIELDQGN